MIFVNNEIACFYHCQVSCVLVGFDPHLSYIKMIKGATYASQKNTLFLATNEDPFLPTKEKVVIPGILAQFSGAIIMLCLKVCIIEENQVHCCSSSALLIMTISRMEYVSCLSPAAVKCQCKNLMYHDLRQTDISVDTYVMD